jgi:hypothetical protein
MSRIIYLSALSLFVAACGGGSAHNKSALAAYRTNKASVAVVSLYVNDYSKVLSGRNVSGSDVSKLIDSKLSEMVTITEQKLGTHFTVKATNEFAASDDFRKAASGQQFEVYAPRYEDKPLPIFAADRGELIKAQMTPEQAKQICTTLGVDMIVAVYSEWATQTGGFVPTTKPLTKTVLAIYDKTGEQLYGQRKDQLGGRNVGAFTAAAVNEDTINGWVEAYTQALQFMVDGL